MHGVADPAPAKAHARNNGKSYIDSSSRPDTDSPPTLTTRSTSLSLAGKHVQVSKEQAACLRFRHPRSHGTNDPDERSRSYPANTAIGCQDGIAAAQRAGYSRVLVCEPAEERTDALWKCQRRIVLMRGSMALAYPTEP